MAKTAPHLHHGRILKKLVAQDSRTNEEIAAAMGITRSPLQVWMKKATLTDEQLWYCKKAGYDIEALARASSKALNGERKGVSIVVLEGRIEQLEEELGVFKAEVKNEMKELFKEIYQTRGMIAIKPK